MSADSRYTIHGEIARGGMGLVSEATDTVLGRTVALKQALSLDPAAVRRFERETRITARLEHPSIVPVHDAGVSPAGLPFYVMRKVSGRALEDLIARAETLNQRLALVPNVVAAAHAIAHAHERGIVHRDIKPSNILVGDAGETIVIDWGLAKAIGEAEATVDERSEPIGDSDTRAGSVIGTRGFMAPEQLRGQPVDKGCDVYALGATLYHLLARKPPHYDEATDEIMRAAADHPPQPVSELVDGVPPELATIVDKALAHDASHRYQDAGALAVELQRFLTGQLVAAHYYTPRERIARFVRKHRAAVSIAATAILALAVVALVLIQQIRNERDRADQQAQLALAEKQIAEQNREHAIRNSRELVLGNARHATAIDPTRATALVKQLAETELWRHARDVGAAASVHGVAFSMPASPHTLTLELARDGQRALAAGDDGVVRIYDLARREGRVVADMKGAVMARFADGERKIVLFQGNRLTVVDAASGARRDVTAPTAISRLEVSGPIAFWVDPANRVWKLDLAGTAPAPVEVSEPVVAVAPSSDGRWIALAGRDHLLLVDRTSSSLPPEIIAEGQALAMTWSADAGHLVALFESQIVEVAMEPSPQIVRRLPVGKRFSVAYSAGRIFSAGPEGVEQIAKDGNKLRAPGPGHSLGVYEGRERTVISARPQGEIVVLSDLGDHVLHSPQPIAMIATSPIAPWIVAAVPDRLLTWSLDTIEPRPISRKPPSSVRFVTGDQLIVTYVDAPAEWIDLRTHKSTPLGELQAIESVVTAPDGAEAIIIDAQRRARRVAGVGQPQELDGEITAAAFVDPGRLIVAVPGGLRLDSQQPRSKLALFRHEPELRGLAATAAGGGWVSATFADGLVWRKNLATSTTTELKLAPSAIRTPIAIGDNGTVVVAIGGELRAWRADGAVATLVPDVKAVSAIALVDPVTAVVTSDDGSIWLVDLLRPSPPAASLTARGASLSRDQGLLAAQDALGGIEIIDPLTNWRWPLATPQKGQPPYSFVEIAPDGSRVVATTASAVLVWTLALPRNAEQTKRWLDTMTNAVAETPSGPLGWQ